MKDEVMVNVPDHLQALKTDALGKLTIYLSISYFVCFLAFLLRLSDFDWQSIYYIHFACFTVGSYILFLTLKKKSLKSKRKRLSTWLIMMH